VSLDDGINGTALISIQDQNLCERIIRRWCFANSQLIISNVPSCRFNLMQDGVY
jgi:hypothetical protein